MHIVEKEFVTFMEKAMTEFDFKNLNVAFSGGVDSVVLLYLFNKYYNDKTCALHVNHGISKNALDWETKCINSAKSYGVEIKVAHFHLAEEKSNLEEKARLLRYGFFEDNMNSQSALITGHHMDDQAETFFLRLMRGAGIEGLSGMRPIRDFSTGKFLRPLLTVTKDDIIDFAQFHNLTWVEDESNKDCHYDRNFIRNQIMPLLKTRWNKASSLISRSASHCQKATDIVITDTVNEINDISLSDTQLDKSLFLNKTKEKQLNILRYWIKLKSNGILLDSKPLSVIIDEVISSKNDSSACYEGQTFFIRIYKNRICFLYKNETFEFNVLNDSTIRKEDNRVVSKILINGVNKKIKNVLKENDVPYWDRSKYSLFFNNDDQLVSVGSIFSDFASDTLIIEKNFKANF